MTKDRDLIIELPIIDINRLQNMTGDIITIGEFLDFQEYLCDSSVLYDSVEAMIWSIWDNYKKKEVYVERR